MAQITPEGITGTTLREYQTLMQNAYESIDPNWIISPESPDGQQIAIWSEVLAQLDEEVQYAWMSVDPNTAIGQSLDRIAAFAEINRKPATSSTVEVTLGGVTGTSVPAGSKVRNKSTGTIWTIQANTIIPGSVATVCDTPGEEFAAIGDMSEIYTPIAGWQSVTNASPAVLGRDEESDDVFRARRTESVGLPGSNQVDNIKASVASVDGVLQSIVYENPNSAVDANGLADHSIAIIVSGGADAEIHSAIAAKKNPGCGMNAGQGFPNEVTAQTTTPLGNPVTITFFRPETVTIFIDIVIATATMAESDKQTIKENIIEYTQEGINGVTGFDSTGFKIGEKIVANKLYTPVNQIVADQGYVESIFVGMSSPAGALAVPIAFNELGVFDIDNINIEYVLP